MLKIVMVPAVALSVFSFSTVSHAKNASDCIKISNDLDRLACYDEASGRTPQIKVEKSKGSWEAYSTTSKLTDDKNVFVSVDSNETVNCSFGRGSKVTLMLRCMENTTAIFFSTQCHMTSSKYSDYGDVTYRLDTDKAKTVSMDNSTDNRALGLWSGGTAIPFIKEMFDKSTMVARMTPYNESPFTATFDISNAKDAVKELREACHW